jgi:hypothetical protein
MSPEAGIIQKTSSSGALFTVLGTSCEPHLILGENITLKGYEGNTSRLVIIGNDSAAANKGKLTMLADSKITGNKYTGTTNNTGGGVYVGVYGVFNMEGGSIEGNTLYGTAATTAGAGVFVAGNFVLDGGTIKNNSLENSNLCYGGGVYVSMGTFTMKSGLIKGNVAHYNGTAADGKFGLGGGVAVKAGFTMEGGTIEGNTAERGGGIGTHNTTNMSVSITGGFIKDNHALQTNAGSAIDLLRSDAALTINGGTVYGIDATNNANNTSANTGYAIARRTAYNNTAITHYCNETVTSLSVTSGATGTITGWSTP